ncbi:hypothetical protein EYC80_003885 [Monilinia laxa]|uniref:Uncharacterized protein n=1 Tax=Monilinia laxa TaxID=61186 RepID=A0A5N6KL26_MONLA|nr:hypothetical protein EYC80_003885 [Monilinia laxa]
MHSPLIDQHFLHVHQFCIMGCVILCQNYFSSHFSSKLLQPLPSKKSIPSHPIPSHPTPSHLISIKKSRILHTFLDLFGDPHLARTTDILPVTRSKPFFPQSISPINSIIFRGTAKPVNHSRIQFI